MKQNQRDSEKSIIRDIKRRTRRKFTSEIFDIGELSDGSLIGVGTKENETNSIFINKDDTWIFRSDSLGCTQNMGCDEFATYTTATSEIEINGTPYEYEIYPNPTSDNITIDIDGLYLKSPVSVIYNLQGQIVLKEDNLANIDVSRLLSGIYVVVLRDKGELILQDTIIKI